MKNGMKQLWTVGSIGIAAAWAGQAHSVVSLNLTQTPASCLTVTAAGGKTVACGNSPQGFNINSVTGGVQIQDAASGSCVSANASTLSLETCATAATQVYKALAASSGTLYQVTDGSGKCLAATATSGHEDYCDSAHYASVLWKPTAVTTTSYNFQIQLQSNGSCVSMTASGGKTISCNAADPTQIFKALTVQPVTSPVSHRIQNLATGACIGGSENALVLESCTDPANTDVPILFSDNSKQYQLIATGQCVAASATNVYTDTCAASAATTNHFFEVQNVTTNPSKKLFLQGRHRGVYSGGFSPSNAQAYTAWLQPMATIGAPSKMDYQVDFSSYVCDTSATCPAGNDNPLDGSIGYAISQWAPYPSHMLWSIQIAFTSDYSLANVANGLHDVGYKNAAAAIAANDPQAIIRIGWECNGGWYPWCTPSVGNTSGNAPQDYINAFRHVAQIFLAASPNFTIDWCPALGGSLATPAETLYPGDDIVDVIGGDAYVNSKYLPSAWTYNGKTLNPLANASDRWTWFVNQSYGLQWQKTFAASHNKPMSWAEWGTNMDDTLWIQNMHDWFLANNFAYESYWDSQNNEKTQMSPINGTYQYPNAGPLFETLFSPLP